MWTLVHDYSDIKQMSQKLEAFQTFFEALGKAEKGDEAQLIQIGGIRGFKSKLGEWLNDNDQATRAFTAVLMGITGDQSFSPKLEEFIRDRKPSKNELMVYDRGRALMALGLLGSPDSKPRLAAFLDSKNEYDRSGAIAGLTFLKATEYAPKISRLINDKAIERNDDTSAISFLVETGTARDHKKEIAQSMFNRYYSEKAIAAMYALASLDASEYAADIATLLNDRFRKADAAKALALLNATSYTDKIGALLSDPSGLVRSAAALALGVLKAKKYSPQLAKIMADKESYVSKYAATALLLMGDTPYKEQAKSYFADENKKIYLTDTSFHPFVEAKTRILTAALKKALGR